MFKGIISSDVAVTAGTNVPFTVVRNTNSNTAYNTTNNVVTLNNPGYYDVSVVLVATSTPAAAVTAQLFANGVALTGAESTVVLAATTAGTFTLIDNIKVDPASLPALANISVQFDQPVTVNNAVLLVETRR